MNGETEMKKYIKVKEYGNEPLNLGQKKLIYKSIEGPLMFEKEQKRKI